MNSRKEIKIWTFGCTMENNPKNNFQCLVTFWKYYFPTNFSHFLSHFLSFQKNFISENPPLSTQNPPLHNIETTKTPLPIPSQQQQKKKKKKIKDQRKKADRWLDRLRGGDRLVSGGQRDQPKGRDDLTQKRTRRSRRRRRRSDPVQKSK